MLTYSTVYLTGNYIGGSSSSLRSPTMSDPSTDQIPPDNVPYNDLSDSEMGSDAEGYDLREVSSDVEINPADLDELESDARSASFPRRSTPR